MATVRPSRRGPAKLAQIHAQLLERATNRHGVRPLKRLYRQARERLIGQLVAGLGGGEFNFRHFEIVLGQLEVGLAAMGTEIEDLILRATGEIGSRSVTELVGDLKRSKRRMRGQIPVLSLEESGVQRGFIAGVERSILRRVKAGGIRQGAVRSGWSNRTIERIEGELSLSTLTNDSKDSVIARVSGIIDDEQWRAERIVRTESAYAWGATRQAALEQTASEVPELRKRWIETFDGRTGDDSRVLHGQTVPINKPFTWKKRLPKRAGGGWATVLVMQSPNRPNDRSTVVPVMPDEETDPAHKALTNADLAARGIEVPPGRKDDGGYK